MTSAFTEEGEKMWCLQWRRVLPVMFSLAVGVS
jgi:hypothetical protein